ncbi:MAG: hypothetical protein OWQ54_02970 [Sulfolobaceae archaeon]|nr:hypothetical protein [Sulfolobaceae archaeon]
MSRAKQLLKEAIDELKKGSILASQMILEDLYNNFEKYLNQEDINYDFTLDNLILLTLGAFLQLKQEIVAKQKFYVSSFLVYDILISNKLTVQNPYFKYIKAKRYFIFSERIENRIKNLAYNGFLFSGEQKIILLDKGKMESINLLKSIDKHLSDQIIKIVGEVSYLNSKKELMRYVEQYLANLLNRK